ncbi:hypothetical protein J8L88_17595 [Aquimarina sp. MMG015]|uniref:hypothetical protein n=1 Tax=Aquimarina sp. MMG015 TaxID=2822689 RepID=UPI001B39FED9|nr:hypothetical protein [Aquimarina sp. MMG015]MBQ4804680.1 hypothetical protein [Aquimarina sp. MMG015]
MLKKKKAFYLFIFYLLPIQYTAAQLPYYEKVTYKKNSERSIIAKIIDDLGYKYYWVTDSLLSDELSTNFYSGKLPRLLLEDAYQMSENIINSVSDKVEKSKLNKGETSFDEMRKNTLLNLKEASNKLINNKETLLFLNWNDFKNAIIYADAYCDQIILFRNDVGNPYSPKQSDTKKNKSNSQIFEESIGADGITNKQWKKIMERGGGYGAHDRIRSTSRKNQETLIKLKKKERASIKTGNLEKIKITTNSVDGLTYVYSSFPPKQLSFLYNNDNELVRGLVDWVIYINSGNSVELSEMLRVGLDNEVFIDYNINQSLVKNRYRDIIDQNNNRVRLEFSATHFDKIKFSNVKITKVIIKKSLIRFFGETDNSNEQSEKEVIIILKHIEGNLLNRIIDNINQTRKGLNEYDDTILNLSKY